MKKIGEAGQIDTETEGILIENDIDFSEFPEEVSVWFLLNFYLNFTGIGWLEEDNVFIFSFHLHLGFEKLEFSFIFNFLLFIF